MRGCLESRMQNHSFKGSKNYMCDNVKGANCIILCVCFLCTCKCEHVKLGLLQQFEKRIS